MEKECEVKSKNKIEREKEIIPNVSLFARRPLEMYKMMEHQTKLTRVGIIMDRVGKLYANFIHTVNTYIICTYV